MTNRDVMETPTTALRQQLFAAAICGIITAIIAIVPHFAMFASHGTLDYLASGDDVIYLAVTRPAVYGEAKLRDPYAIQSQRVPTAFSWFQFFPWAWPFAQLGVPLLMLPLWWRLIGGVLCGFAVFWLAGSLTVGRRYSILVAMAVGLFLMNDRATVIGIPVIDSLRLLPKYWAGQTPMGFADGVGQYRVVSPLLNYPLLFVIVGILLRPERSWRRTVVAGVACGCLVLSYFFFWTGIVGALAIYGCIQLARHFARHADARREAIAIGAVLILALVLGGGQVVNNSLTFADPAYREALDRTSLGYRMPAGDPVRSQYVRSLFALTTLLVSTVVLCWRYRPQLALAFSFTLSGYLLRNSAIVTGLEFENYHWSFIQNFGISLTWIVLGLIWLPNRRWVSGLAIVGTLALVLGVGVWRYWECQVAPQTVAVNATLRELRQIESELQKLGPNTSLAGPIETNIAVLLNQAGQLYCVPHTAHRSLIPDAEVHLRHAGNAWLMGTSETDYFQSLETHESFSMTPSARAEWQPAFVQARRLEAFRQVDANPALLEPFAVAGILCPVDGPKPRGGPWRVAGTTTHWILYLRTESP